MDKRLEEIKENYERMRIGVDEPFRFHCTQCGDCCRNREDIILSAQDIYRMSKELGLTTAEIAGRYCEVYIGNDSRVPIIRLKPEGDDRRCPMLKDNECAVHRAKPTVCAMFPIGRCFLFGTEDRETNDDTPKTEYIFVNPGCGDDKGTQTVREWFDAFGIPLDDPFSSEWNQLIVHVSGVIQTIEKDLHECLIGVLWDIAVQFMYLQYDTHKEFMPQFERNAAVIRNTLADFMGGIPRSIPPSRQSPNAHVNMVTWLVARGNKAGRDHPGTGGVQE